MVVCRRAQYSVQSSQKNILSRVLERVDGVCELACPELAVDLLEHLWVELENGEEGVAFIDAKQGLIAHGEFFASPH